MVPKRRSRVAFPCPVASASVLEEKTNKIAEVIVSSMKASHLMLGKIVGVGGVALLQVAIWAAVTGVMSARSDALTRRFHLPPGALDVIHIPIGTVLATVASTLSPIAVKERRASSS